MQSPKSAANGPLKSQRDEFNASTILESAHNPCSNFPGIHRQANLNLSIGWLGVRWESGSGPNCQACDQSAAPTNTITSPPHTHRHLLNNQPVFVPESSLRWRQFPRTRLHRWIRWFTETSSSLKRVSEVSTFTSRNAAQNT